LTNNLIDLPVLTTPMHVALVYNQKKEDETQQSDDDSAEPPSTIRRDKPSGTFLTSLISDHHHATDLYAEWDSRKTIEAVRDALSEIHDVVLVEADEFAFERLRGLRPDIVFNIAEGMRGVSREAQIPAMLEFLQIPYTGSDPLTLAICLDKSRAKEILAYSDIPTPRFAVVDDPKRVNGAASHLPCVVKPLHEGSSKGIYNSSVVRTRKELEEQVAFVLDAYNQPALVEEFLSGREFTVAMLGNDDTLTVLPIVEIKFDSLPGDVNPIYSFEAKWIWDRSDAPLKIFECPANIPPGLRNEIEGMCRRAYSVLRCRDWCRIDVRLDSSGRPQILELNPLPGILPKPEDNSCFPKAARAAGLSYNYLIQTVLAIAARRYCAQMPELSFQPTHKERIS